MLHQGLRITLCCGLLALPVLAADDKGEKTDKERLQGTWLLISVEKEGKKIEMPAEKQDLLTFTGDRAAFKSEKRNDDGPFTLDAAKKPKEIDLLNPKADDKEKMALRAIYELGGDKLRLAFPAKREGPRPAGFDAKDIVIVTFARKK